MRLEIPLPQDIRGVRHGRSTSRVWALSSLVPPNSRANRSSSRHPTAVRTRSRRVCVRDSVPFTVGQSTNSACRGGSRSIFVRISSRSAAHRRCQAAISSASPSLTRRSPSIRSSERRATRPRKRSTGSDPSPSRAHHWSRRLSPKTLSSRSLPAARSRKSSKTFTPASMSAPRRSSSLRSSSENAPTASCQC